MSNKTQHTNLRAAKKAKQDEFYTQLTDIEKELKHYRGQFKDQIVFCNADDPFESNFFKYFAANFNLLGLKRLIATSYAGSPIVGDQLSILDIEGVKKEERKEPMKIEINEVKDFNNDGAVDITDVEHLLKHDKNSAQSLKGSGDFRSDECVEILKEADIVVTNPPFSLFREYVSHLISYDKKFLIIGSQNAITYKEVFNYIKSNQLWIGYKSGDMSFRVPDHYEARQTRFWIDESGQKWRSLGNICWYTNLDISKRHEDLILFKNYSSEEYPMYDNYNAINVNKVRDIPVNYEGYMGVPITFLDKFNPSQFEIFGIMNTGEENKGIRYENTPHGRPIVNGVEKYLRIIIRKIEYEN